MVKIVAAIPYRPDFGHRDQLFTHLKTNFWNIIGFELLIGANNDDPFNRSKALNQALTGSWDVAILADADTWVAGHQLQDAIKKARTTHRLTAAFDTVIELNRTTTMSILAGKTPLSGSFDGAEKIRTREYETQSSMLVITRDLWDQVGGFDERFTGWGCEDNAFFKACELHGGTAERVTGNAFHLWHPPAKGKFHGIQYKRNLNLWMKYQQAQSVDEIP